MERFLFIAAEFKMALERFKRVRCA